MQSETVFRILLPTLILAFAAHRGYYVKNHSRPGEATLKARQEGAVSKISALLGMLGFVSVVVYSINSHWLAWAELPLPTWIRWAGIGAALLGFALLQWAQAALGNNWSDMPRMMKEQRLVTSGPYRAIRHPIYTAFILILGSTLLISANWLVGLCWAGMTILEVVSRIRFEEPLMIEYFGDQYREYMKKTGRLVPRL
jgi:protein-S-isoprenylcysteine O-methyltransferase Ste14